MINRPTSKDESDDIVDLVALSQNMDSKEIEDIVLKIAPGNEAILSIFMQIRGAPFLDESFLDYFKSRVWQEIQSI